MAFPLHPHDPLCYDLGAFNPLKGEFDVNKSFVRTRTSELTRLVSVMKLNDEMTLKEMLFILRTKVN
jgi:hypothetical protein